MGALPRFLLFFPGCQIGLSARAARSLSHNAAIAAVSPRGASGQCETFQRRYSMGMSG